MFATFLGSSYQYFSGEPQLIWRTADWLWGCSSYKNTKKLTLGKARKVAICVPWRRWRRSYNLEPVTNGITWWC